MTLKEALSNFEKEIKCREEDVGEFCLSNKYCIECPYYVSGVTLVESMRVAVKQFQELQKGEQDE